MSLTKRLLKIKDKVEQMEKDYTKLSGQIEMLEEEIKNEFNTNSISKLKTKIKEKKKKLKEKKSNRSKLVKELEEQMEEK